MQATDAERPHVDAEKDAAPVPSSWANDGADTFILLSSLLLTLASIALVVLIFVGHALEWDYIPEGMQVLQRAISALSLSVTSALVVLFGKRYVFSKLSTDGIRSQRIALYSNATIGSLIGAFLRFRVELLSIALLAVWALGLATGITVNNSVRLAPLESDLYIGLPVGSLDPKDIIGDSTSLVGQASARLDYVVSSLVSGVDGVVGLVNVTGAKTTTGDPMGSIYYPPLPAFTIFGEFVTPGILNSFQISVDQPTSVPSTAQKYNCTQAYGVTGPDIWMANANTQSFTIIIGNTATPETFYQFTATAIVMGGTISAHREYTEFALNGTTWSLTMSDNQWASQIMDMICNTVTPNAGDYGGTSLLDFAYWLNERDMYDTNSGEVSDEMLWTSVLGAAVGAYSAAKWPEAAMNYNVVTQAAFYSYMRLTPYYGVYVLIIDIVASIAMLFVAWRLRKASDLRSDFMNPTRLLLDPLTKPGLFNAPLQTTVNAVGDPYLLVTQNKELLIKSHK
ncbi:hypothetical protein HYDPIDRAFT_43552 [Hydnomerulius pinastri MD-312]|uniref:Uncharacterized protein n=1 Tax=Hydnomerulius pinastri MD-312 TaxID=994086 RepID=A0A0C9V446_9AGAM|nr:hypothetical protein HYDPIDRAFT_43552 [Hydnomerulius pinastri MD-312]